MHCPSRFGPKTERTIRSHKLCTFADGYLPIQVFRAANNSSSYGGIYAVQQERKDTC